MNAKKQPARRMKPWRSSRHPASSVGGHSSFSGHHGGRLPDQRPGPIRRASAMAVRSFAVVVGHGS